jgi:hypothetical protein
MWAWRKRGGNFLGDICVCRKNNLKVDVKNEFCVVDGVLTIMSVGMNRLVIDGVDRQVL